ncbi:MAG: CcmD family protein [Deltaproteobacteria bacterium]|nr:CcmD family protein [Deltaproteobacteria bacterium]
MFADVTFEASKDVVSGEFLLSAAYIFIWLAFFAYAFTLQRKVKRLEEDVEELKGKGGSDGE